MYLKEPLILPEEKQTVYKLYSEVHFHNIFYSISLNIIYSASASDEQVERWNSPLAILINPVDLWDFP